MDLVSVIESQVYVGWDDWFKEHHSVIETISKILKKREEEGEIIGPPIELVFRAFQLTPRHFVKVVILGQDPYPGCDADGQSIARGMCFSVGRSTPVPRSLENIFKEIKNEYSDYEIPDHGDLSNWAKQGVLLLNTALTIEVGKIGSHLKRGFWSSFLHFMLKTIIEENPDCIFVLWGNESQKCFEQYVKKEGVIKLESPHPSGMSAYRGFFGNGHFRKINEILAAQGKSEIDWQT